MYISDRITGCLLGSAYGDSLGAAVEFLSYNEILHKYGNKGILFPAPFSKFKAGSVTDDTQQSLAICVGFSHAMMDEFENDQAVLRYIWGALKQWRVTQSNDDMRRSPGNTSLRSLTSEVPGTLISPLNHSNSCGSVMRGHVVGVAFYSDEERAFNLGKQIACLTHGGRDSRITAGLYAVLIAKLCNGESLQSVVSWLLSTAQKMQQDRLHNKLVSMIEMANQDNENRVKQIESIGGGWGAVSAFLIGFFSALVYSDSPLEALRLSVNHGGDSDSTGAICGAIMGAIHGIEVVPRVWVDRLEYADKLLRYSRLFAELKTV